MTTDPRVSVIVPTAGRAALLSRLLESLRQQSYRDFEIVVVNDGATQDVADVLGGSAAEGLDVHEVCTDGVGAVEARRLGVQTARGDVLAFTDSDCIADEDWLAAGVRALDEADADVVQGLTVPQREVGPMERSVAHSVNDGLFATCNIFYRRASYEAVGGFDTGAQTRLGFRADVHAKRLGFGEDTLLGWAVARKGRVADARDAIVRHEVFRPSLRELFSRAWQAGGFPSLYREVPELNGRLIRYGVLLGNPGTRLFAYPLIAALLLRRPKPAALAAACWLVGRLRRGERPSAALVVELGLDVTSSAALIAGSVRARKVVL